MGWRSKFIFLLIVYFAGFATAVYFLAPAPDGRSGNLSADLQLKAVNTNQIVNSLNAGMHKCVDLGKVAAKEAADYIKNKYEKYSEDEG
jgi:hypothetical protein